MNLFKPQTGLKPDSYSGGAIQNSGLGELSDKWIEFRNHTTGGVVPNAETQLTPTVDNELVAGILDVSFVAAITIACRFTLGSLVTADIIPKFTDNGGSGVDHYLASLVGAAVAAQSKIYTLAKTVFRMDATGNYIWTIPNPGAKYLKLFTASATTTTGSLLGVWVGRGWQPSGTPFIF